MDIVTRTLKQFQKLILPHQKQIINVLFGLELLLVVIWVLAVWLAFVNPRQVYALLEFGARLGTASMLLFVLSLLPGIITRSKILSDITLPISTLIIPFRRHIGILMFLTAFVHMSFSSTLPYIASQLSKITSIQPMTIAQQVEVLLPSLPPPFRLFEQVAIVAWLVLLPVWLTSNDFSMKRLGPWWKRVQRLTYLALWFIFIHVAMQASSSAILLFGVGILEVYSWFVVWRTKQASVQ